jgi:hypothetical protein
MAKHSLRWPRSDPDLLTVPINPPVSEPFDRGAKPLVDGRPVDWPMMVRPSTGSRD